MTTDKSKPSTKEKKKYEYVTVPLNKDVAFMVEELCSAYEMGRRGKGALVSKLVRAEYRKLHDVKLVADVPAGVNSLTS